MEQNRKRLRLIERGYESYTGQIGRYQFVEGVSEEEILTVERDRISAAMACVEINEDGSEEQAGFAARYLRDYATRIEPVSHNRVTESQKVEEDARVVFGGDARKLYSVEAIEAVAAKRGIAGVRVLAGPWNVRSKSIPDLIKMIVAAQDDYRADGVAQLTAKGVAQETIEGLFQVFDAVPEELFAKPDMIETVAPAPAVEQPAVEEKQAANANSAAVTGDLAAALNAE